MKRILLVEDDLALREVIASQLTQRGYSIVSAPTAREAATHLHDKQLDLALIDIGLPDSDGFSVARELRQNSDMPFIFLTAMNSPEFRLEGYELGAADYIPKPFHMKELALRVDRVLDVRREKLRPLQQQGILIDPDSRILEVEGNTPTQLTERECSLLYHLLAHTPSIISRDQVLHEVWGDDAGAQQEALPRTSHRTVDNVIVKLRQALGKEHAKYLSSVRGAGYQWRIK